MSIFILFLYFYIAKFVLSKKLYLLSDGLSTVSLLHETPYFFLKKKLLFDSFVSSRVINWKNAQSTTIPKLYQPIRQIYGGVLENYIRIRILACFNYKIYNTTIYFIYIYLIIDTIKNMAIKCATKAPMIPAQVKFVSKPNSKFYLKIHNWKLSHDPIFKVF